MTSPPVDKNPPCDLEVEKLVLGYILIDGKIDFDIAEEDFYLDIHRKVLRHAKAIQESGKSPDMLTMISDLRSTNEIESCGGILYLQSLTDGVPRMRENLVTQYVAILREKAGLRKLISIFNDGSDMVFSGEGFSSVHREAMSRIDLAQVSMGISEGPVPVSKSVKEAYDEIEKITESRRKGTTHGLQLGLKELDGMIPSGIKPDDFMVIASRPGHGKTSLLLHVLSTMAESGRSVLFLSIEMSAVMIMMRMLASRAEVDLSSLTSGYVSKEDWVRLSKAASVMSGWKSWIDDSPDIQVTDIRARVRRIGEPIHAIMVDYLQLLGVPKSGQKNENEKVSEISRNLKAISKDLKIPVIAASQLSRASEKRKGGEPQLSDLRQSGHIEQDCDIALFIHRADISSDDHTAPSGTAKLLLRKQRNGPTGSVEVAWMGKYTKFGDLWSADGSQTKWYDQD